MTNNTINNVPRELLLRDAANEGMNATTRQHQIDHFAGLIAKADALLSDPSTAGVDGLNTDRNAAFKACPESGYDWGSFYLGWKARGEVEQAIIDGLRGEVERLRDERDSFQRIGIRQIEHRYQLAALLLEKFPRIDPHHPITLSEVDHCCEYVLHKDRERLHCAIDAALSAGKEGE